MDFSLNADQQMLRDSVEKFVAKACGFDGYRRTLALPGQTDPAIWQQFAEFGWLALTVPEARGGLGGSAVDSMVVAAAFGAGMVIEPFVASAILGTRLLALATPDAENQRDAIFAAVLDGSAQLAVAYAERGAGYDISCCTTRASVDLEGYRLSGRKIAVLNAPNARWLIVSARCSGGDGDDHGIGLFLVERDAPGLSVDAYAVMGGGGAAELRLDGVRVGADALLASPANGHRILERALDYAIAASCAQALGAMEALLARTADYARMRKQFGVAIGSFQAIQHRIVDMFLEVQQARSMVCMASVLADSEDRDERRRAVSAAKAYLGRAARLLSQQAVQLHGGIGVTEELDVGHYFRQLTAFRTLFGDRDHHLERFAACPPAADQ